MEQANKFVSRAGYKLELALENFKIEVAGLVAADLGCSTGGFTDCLLQRGASKVYAIDTGYGVLDWKLRNDGRVVVMERTNAMHLKLPELVDIVASDTSWTRLKLVVPVAKQILKPDGRMVALMKPHYEADRKDLVKGQLRPEKLDEVKQRVEAELKDLGCEILGVVESPLVGQKGGNTEFLFLLKP